MGDCVNHLDCFVKSFVGSIRVNHLDRFVVQCHSLKKQPIQNVEFLTQWIS